MTSLNFVGIDPGKSGAIAVSYVENDRPKWDILTLAGATERDIHDFLHESITGYMYDDPSCIWFGMIERVAASPQMGVTSAFTFGRSYGTLRGIMIGAGLAFDEVLPQKWQKAMGCLTKGDKNVTKAKAQQLFPGEKITHANADAMLLAEYARRTYLSGAAVATVP